MVFAHMMDEALDLDGDPFTEPFFAPSSLPQNPNFAPPNPHHVDTSHQFISPQWISSVQPNALHIPHTSHDDTCIDSCTGGYNPQMLYRGGFMPSTNLNGRVRGGNLSISYPYQTTIDNTLLQPAPQLNHTNHAFIPDQGFLYDFSQDYRNSNDFTSHLGPLGNEFTTTDLGIFPQCQHAEECVSLACSRVSCSTQCCSSSQVCQDEKCSGDGTPCNDQTCLEGTPKEGIPALDPWTIPMLSDLAPFSLPHGRPCNHTNTEHDVALTLQELSAPAILDTQQEISSPLDSTILGAGEQFLDRSTQSPSNSSHPCTEVRHPGSSYPQVPSRPISSLSNNPSHGVTDPEIHICQWIINNDESEAEKIVCGMEFTDIGEFQAHLCNFHIGQMSSKTKYRCLWHGCTRKEDQLFASRNKLRRHISTHTAYKPFICKTCNTGFSAQQALEQHERIHTGHKPFVCNFPGCEKSFKQKSALTMHARTHTGEKPLKCDICSKCFCESSNLSKHKKIHLAEFKYKCPWPGCEKAFIRVDQLRRHQLRHERPKNKQKIRSQVSRSVSMEASTTSEDTPIMNFSLLPNTPPRKML
ncbi:hypothetical protein F5Y19DRAFT_423178 [Xylariaceae sp. FL1651]|nr:hypothetical protein F5Y19DRAFT_423178 [Xylariaceae sp. FL1651]